MEVNNKIAIAKAKLFARPSIWHCTGKQPDSQTNTPGTSAKARLLARPSGLRPCNMVKTSFNETILAPQRLGL